MRIPIILGCLIANIFLYPIGLALTRAVAKIIQVRYTYLAPIIIIFCFAGAFAAYGQYERTGSDGGDSGIQLSADPARYILHTADAGMILADIGDELCNKHDELR